MCCFYVSGLKLVKQGMFTLPGTGRCSVNFGQCHNALVTRENKPEKLQHFKLNDEDSLQLVWEKQLPEGIDRKRKMWTTPDGRILMQHDDGRLLMFTSNLKKISEFKLPGAIRGMTTGQHLVVDDAFTAASQKDGLLRLDVRSASSPESTQWKLRTPASRAYKRDDWLFACGSADGTVAVVEGDKPHVDFYEPGGM